MAAERRLAFFHHSTAARRTTSQPNAVMPPRDRERKMVLAISTPAKASSTRLGGVNSSIMLSTSGKGASISMMPA